jgi:hypothetical protein
MRGLERRVSALVAESEEQMERYNRVREARDVMNFSTLNFKMSEAIQNTK